MAIGATRHRERSAHAHLASALPLGILTVLIGGCALATLGLIASAYPDPPHILAAAGILLLVVALQAGQCRRALAGPGEPAGPRAEWMLLAQLVLTYAPLVVFFESWLLMATFLAGTGLLLPATWRWLVFIVVMAVQAVLAAILQDDAGQALAYLVCTAAIGLMIFGVVRLGVLVREVTGRQARLVELELIRERVRIDRDLHDMLSNRLAVIALKCELAERLVGTDPPRAHAELNDVIDIARGAQSDVRTLAHGRAKASVSTELASARSALEAAGIKVEIALSCTPLPDDLANVLVAIVREAVTNILRHSTAAQCRIELLERDGRIRVSVVNDGVSPYPDAQDGSGLTNLRERTVAVGGRLFAGVREDGRFHLEARIANRSGRTVQETGRIRLPGDAGSQ